MSMKVDQSVETYAHPGWSAEADRIMLSSAQLRECAYCVSLTKHEPVGKALTR